MNNLEEQLRERFNASWISHPVTGRTGEPSHGKDRKQDTAAFWLADAFTDGDTEPLPAMFRSRLKHSETEPRSARARLAVPAPPARLSKFSISKRTASYIIASFLLVFAAVDGVLLTASTSSAGRAMLIGPVPAVLDQDGTGVDMSYPVPSSDAAEGSQSPSLASVKAGLPDNRSWPAALDTLEALLAQQKASRTAAVKQVENDQALARLEAWMNARTQKPAGLAEACQASPAQCWKGATQIQ